MVKKAFFKMAAVAILNFKNFSHVTVIVFNICCSVPNVIKSDDFSLRYGDLTIFKMAAVRHLGFQKFAVVITSPLSACGFASLCKISLKSHNG